MHIKSLLVLFISLLFSVGSARAGALHVFTSDASGFNTHSFWYDDAEEVTVVDTQFTPDLARALVADIRAHTQSPITRVIVTHPSPDKFNALPVFHALGARSLASEATSKTMPAVDAYKRRYWTEVAKAFTPETYPRLEAVQDTFRGEKRLRLKSGETLTLLELKHPGVASTQTAVRIDRTGDLLVGDLVAYGAHAWLEGGIVNGQPTPTLQGWMDDLAALPRIGHGTLYGGRGGSGPIPQFVQAQVAYLRKADALVSRFVTDLGPKAIELRDPAKAGAHFKTLQTAFERAFPGIALPELIGYGVYGWALSKLPAHKA